MSKRNTLLVQTYRAVNADDLFRGLAALEDEFFNSDPDFSWGDNDHTLVKPEAILSHFDGDWTENPRQVATLRTRIANLPSDVFIDLEN